MKALVYTANEEVTFRDEPEPQPGADDVVIEVESVGICGSDMHAYLGHDPRRVPPLVLGHEVAGTIVDGPSAGTRAVLNPLITCGKCDSCVSGRENLCRDRELIGMNRPGGFAERLAIPSRNVIPIPDAMLGAHAALTEPGATALHALALAQRAAWRPVNELNALVIGGGSVGLLTALLLKDCGARAIALAETNERRRRTAADTGVCEVLDPTAQSIDEGQFDLVFDAVGGARTRAAAVQAVRPGGVLVHIGLQDNDGAMDVRKLTLSEITFIGTYTYTTLDLRACVNKLHSGALGSLDWVEERPLADGARAFDDLLKGLSAAPKIVLHP